MSTLTKEEKAYILEAGESWDGRTVYDKIRGINKKNNEAVDELVWILENMEKIRGCLNREFKSKYGDPKRSWEGKDAPKRSSFESHHVISKPNMEKLLKLYILESEDVRKFTHNPKWNKQNKVRVKKRVEELKESLISTISEIEFEID